MIVQIQHRDTDKCVQQFTEPLNDVDAYCYFNDRMSRNFGMDMDWVQFNKLFRIVRFEEVQEVGK